MCGKLRIGFDENIIEKFSLKLDFFYRKFLFFFQLQNRLKTSSVLCSFLIQTICFNKVKYRAEELWR